MALSWAALVACRATERASELTAAPWPAADELFHGDPRWRGADAAFSVDLGGGRVLWLFGDTFVVRERADAAHPTRRDCTMVRNSAALQTGYDPSRARIEFAWGRGPSSWLAEEGEDFFWPQHGLRVAKGALVLFYSRVESTPGVGLGFTAVGWKAIAVDEPDRPLAEWSARELEEPELPQGLVAAQGLNLVGDHVVGLAVREPGDHAGYLLRFPAADFARGELAGCELWCGEWQPASRALEPLAVLSDAAPESSLHFDGEARRWIHVRSLGFGAATLALSFADELTGPWSEPLVVHTPEESKRANAFVYAGKAHPELAGADLVLTYASNNLDFAELVADESLYYPRFVRVWLR